MSKFARRCAALMLAVVLLCMAVPAAFAAEGDTLPAGATTMGGANTTLIPDEEENCLSWLFGSGKASFTRSSYSPSCSFSCNFKISRIFSPMV